MSTPTESVTLYYRQGSSDKVYQASIEEKDEGFVVNFAFGRRGSTLQTGTKTPQSVDHAAAKKIYDTLVAEKIAKGYTPGESGTPYQQTQLESRATGILPQLLNSIDEDEAIKLISHDDWCMQEKFDGKRVLIRNDGRTVAGINRKGLTIALPQPILDQAQRIGDGSWLMDGEAVGDIYWAFDVLEWQGQDVRQQPYSDRLAKLAILELLGRSAAIRQVTTATSTKQKLRLFDQIQKRKAEGVVFKRHAAPYSPGRPASGGDQLKCKFYSTASGIVSGVPLMLFSAGAQKIPLTLVGMLQYISPTIQFFLGVFLYGEAFDHTRVVGFSIIWLALLIYSLEGWVERRKALAVEPA
jgi:bifunctional non-homologous end joining protein LigD